MIDPEIKQYIEDKLMSQIHDGNLAQQIIFSNLFGNVKTVSSPPTYIPNNISEQIVIYGGALYYYNFNDGTWYTTGSSGAPGGSNTQLQFNDSGSFGGALIEYTQPDTDDVQLKVSDQPTSSNSGINLTILAGKPNGSNDGGGINITGADGVTLGVGGSVTLSGGIGAGSAKNGGDVVLQPGTSGSAQRGTIIMRSASGGVSQRAVGSLTTTNNSYTSVPDTLTASTSGSALLHARITGVRPANGDTMLAEIIQGVKFVTGTPTLVSSLTFLFFYQDNALTDVQFATSGSSVVLQVKGITSQTYDWQYEFWYQYVT